MGEQKRLKGKVIPKHETEAAWLLSNYIPEQGETIIYDVDETHTKARQKIGDGINKVKNLPFIVEQADWQQTDKTKDDYIKNKPSLVGTIRGLDDGNGNVVIVLGSTNSDKIIIPYEGSNYEVYPSVLAKGDTWYKGTTAKSTISTINIVDTYTPTGNETETWNADAYNLGFVKCYVEGTILTIAGSGFGMVSAHPYSESVFEGFTIVTAVNGTDILDVGGCATLKKMWNGCNALITLDTSNWDISKVTNIKAMFQLCNALTTLDTSNWDTHNVTDMSYMFYGCYVLAELDTSNWDTSNVTDMFAMFNQCKTLTEIDVSNWDTSNVTNMRHLFSECYALVELNTSNWDTSNVTNMCSMFQQCNVLTTLDTSNWDTSKVTDMSYMFNKCYALTELDTSNWNTSNVTTMHAMFQLCKALTTLNTSNWYTSNVTDMGYMFRDCYALTTLDVSNWDTSNVTDMSSMFCTGTQNSDNSSLTSIIGIENFDVSKVINMGSMFYSCSKLTHIDVSKWDMTSVQSVRHMFADCTRLESIDITKWKLDSCTNMDGIFNDCVSLTSIDVTNVLTPSVIQLSQVFEGCTNLKQIIGLNTWNTNKVEIFNEMFQNCGIAILDLSSFDTSSVPTDTRMTNMFTGCNNLSQVTLGSAFEFNGSNCYLPTPSSEYITGADGKWYNRANGTSYEPSAVPSNTAATYYATAV